jgi:type VI secretion system protein VasG
MGSPPGYVGYGEGGILTEAVRRRPYSVILLDEMEKAHVGVQDVFFQVFDKGNMKDGEGRDIDFKNTVIIMTSNAGTDLITKLFADPDTAPDAAGLADALRPELMKYFKPAFLGRVTLVPYFPLSDEVIRKIVVLQLNKIGKRVRDAYRATFEYDPILVETIAARCTESSSGARNVENILSRTLLPELSADVLARLAEGDAISHVSVGMNPEGTFRYSVG